MISLASFLVMQTILRAESEWAAPATYRPSRTPSRGRAARQAQASDAAPAGLDLSCRGEERARDEHGDLKRLALILKPGRDVHGVSEDREFLPFGVTQNAAEERPVMRSDADRDRL